MTNKVTIINHGPKPMQLTGELLAKPIIIPPYRFAEMWMHAPLQIDEAPDDGGVVTPNLAGGHGEEGG